MATTPFPDDWNGEDFCRYAVCWPDSNKWKAILYGLIEMPNYGRFWDFETGNFLETRESFRPAYDYNFVLKEVIMACGDNGLSEGLQAIAEALSKMADNQAKQNEIQNQISLNNNVCCEQTIINSGGGISGNVETPNGQTTPVYGTQPPKEVTPGTYPLEFGSQEEYDTHRCEMANLIFDGWLISLRNLAAIGVFNGIALAGLVVAALAGAIVFPPAAIPIMCMAIGVLAVNVTLLAVVANKLEEDREYFVCLLYTSDSVDAIVAAIADALDSIIATLETSGPVGFAIKQICLLLLNSDTLNGLMEKRAHADYPGADCSECSDNDCDLFWGFDFGEEGWTDTVNTGAGGMPEMTWENGTLKFYVTKTSGQNSSGQFEKNIYSENLIGQPESEITVRVFQNYICATGIHIIVVGEGAAYLDHYIDISSNHPAYAEPGQFITLALNVHGTWPMAERISAIILEAHSGSNCTGGQTEIHFDDVCLKLNTPSA